MKDPFIEFRGDVEKDLSMVQSLHLNWRSLLMKVNTATDDEFTWTQKELKKSLAELQQDLSDLEEVSQAILKSPASYKLDQKEAKARGESVKALRKAADDVAADLVSQQTRAKLEKDKLSVLMGSGDSSSTQKNKSERVQRMEQEAARKNQEFIGANNPQVLLKKQDEEIGKLAETISRLRGIASTISTTLDNDRVLLEDLDNHVDRSLVKVKTATKKVEQLQKKI